ncbi:MAG: Na+/H+ antiporter NhaA [Bacteroidota bacterium]
MLVTPADRFLDRVSSVFEKPYAKGLLLLVMVIIALCWANSPFYEYYEFIFQQEFLIGFKGHTLMEPFHVWINDGLMAVFFFTVGLEIKKEVMEGELSSLKKASLPVVAALGGMVVPALIFFGINYGTEAQGAWGIPMATDIAFTLGFISLVGSVVSSELKVFLTALATADDLGAIIVIALFLTPFVDFDSLLAAGVYLGIMAGANYLGVRNIWFYLVVGILGLWIAMFLSGIHATLAGVLGALTIPANRKITEIEYQQDLRGWVEEFDDACSKPNGMLTHRQEEIIGKIVRDSKRANTPLQRLHRQLEPFVNYFILPLFALANTGVRIEGNVLEMLMHPVSLGIIGGLVLGKVIGISGFSWIMVKSKLGDLPRNTNWPKLIGVGFMGGIGFTMSLFIAELALENEELLAIAKLGVICASVLSTIIGMTWLILVGRLSKG